MNNLYYNITLTAVELLVKGKLKNPEDAWDTACREHNASIESTDKSCPKASFITICQMRKIQNYEFWGENIDSKNGIYAMKGLDILSKTKKEYKSVELWKILQGRHPVLNVPDSYNNQMDVVLALWENGYIKK